MTADEPLFVLVVEDDADTRGNLRDILELDGFRVVEAGTIAEALDRDDWKRIAAVILDRKLPDGIAEDVLPRLKQLAPDAPVIIVTAVRELECAIQCLRLGAADFLAKPINADVLRARIANIGERVRAERQMRILARMQQESPNPVLRIDSSGTILYANPASQSLLDFWQCQTDQRLLPVHCEIVRNVLQSGNRRDLEIECGNRIFLMKFTPVVELDYVNLYGHDITELRNAERKALQTERLAAIGQMMAGLAHESRNALQRSQACLEMLEVEVADQPVALDLVARAQHAQDHLQHLYEEVRGYAAPISLNQQPCSAADIWRESWSHLASTLNGKQIRICEEIPEGCLTCNVDSFAIGQVFRNILENALAVSPSHGKILIRCAADELEGRPALRIEVRDQGPGLSAEQKQRIFDPFYTTKTQGTGLGMAIARRIVEAHGGRIAASDNIPSGAEIVVTLPRGET